MVSGERLEVSGEWLVINGYGDGIVVVFDLPAVVGVDHQESGVDL